MPQRAGLAAARVGRLNVNRVLYMYTCAAKTSLLGDRLQLHDTLCALWWSDEIERVVFMWARVRMMNVAP